MIQKTKTILKNIFKDVPFLLLPLSSNYPPPLLRRNQFYSFLTYPSCDGYLDQDKQKKVEYAWVCMLSLYRDHACLFCMIIILAYVLLKYLLNMLFIVAGSKSRSK